MNPIRIAIIGTARAKNQDENMKMGLTLYTKILDSIQSRLSDYERLEFVSGGAAWMDHLAVSLFLRYHRYSTKLTLHLPAAFENGKYLEITDPGRASNHYHKLFYNATGIDSLAQIEEARKSGANFVIHKDFYTRNDAVASSNPSLLLAYSWHKTKPINCGTAYTWNRAVKNGVYCQHTCLNVFCNPESQ
jgi:hypothetical protein